MLQSAGYREYYFFTGDREWMLLADPSTNWRKEMKKYKCGYCAVAADTGDFREYRWMREVAVLCDPVLSLGSLTIRQWN